MMLMVVNGSDGRFQKRSLECYCPLCWLLLQPYATITLTSTITLTVTITMKVGRLNTFLSYFRHATRDEAGCFSLAIHQAAKGLKGGPCAMLKAAYKLWARAEPSGILRYMLYHNTSNKSGALLQEPHSVRVEDLERET